MTLLILNLLTLAASIIFTIAIYKLWGLVQHKSLTIFIISGVIGIALRVVVVLISLEYLTLNNTNVLRIMLGYGLWFLLALGAVLLYFEVKTVFKKGKRL